MQHHLELTVELSDESVAVVVRDRDCEIEVEADQLCVRFVIRDARRFLPLAYRDCCPRRVLLMGDAKQLRPRPLTRLLRSDEYGTRRRDGRGSAVDRRWVLGTLNVRAVRRPDPVANAVRVRDRYGHALVATLPAARFASRFDQRGSVHDEEESLYATLIAAYVTPYDVANVALQTDEPRPSPGAVRNPAGVWSAEWNNPVTKPTARRFAQGS